MNCPVKLEELTGRRRTAVHGGDEVTIHDTIEESRNLQDRWNHQDREG